MIVENRFLFYKLIWAFQEGMKVILLDNKMMGLTSLAFRGNIQVCRGQGTPAPSGGATSRRSLQRATHGPVRYVCEASLADLGVGHWRKVGRDCQGGTKSAELTLSQATSLGESRHILLFVLFMNG